MRSSGSRSWFDDRLRTSLRSDAGGRPGPVGMDRPGGGASSGLRRLPCGVGAGDRGPRAWRRRARAPRPRRRDHRAASAAGGGPSPPGQDATHLVDRGDRGGGGRADRRAASPGGSGGPWRPQIVAGADAWFRCRSWRVWRPPSSTRCCSPSTGRSPARRRSTPRPSASRRTGSWSACSPPGRADALAAGLDLCCSRRSPRRSRAQAAPDTTHRSPALRERIEKRFAERVKAELRLTDEQAARAQGGGHRARRAPAGRCATASATCAPRSTPRSATGTKADQDSVARAHRRAAGPPGRVRRELARGDGRALRVPRPRCSGPGSWSCASGCSQRVHDMRSEHGGYRRHGGDH